MSDEEFKILTPREHVRLRPNMYVGSVSLEQTEQFVVGKWKSVSYVPAILKIINEILDNSIDNAIRTNYLYANKIDITIKDNLIIVSDNGTGIPQDVIKDDNGIEISRPVAAWTRVNAGTSFNDDRVTIGANGVGSTCTNFMSKQFVGKTWRDGNCITVSCSDGGLNINVSSYKKSGNGTSVAFVPDLDLFEQKDLSEYDTVDIMKDRILNLSMAFPKIKFTFNGTRVESVDSFDKYSKMFGLEGASRYAYNSEDLSFLITASEDGFRTNSYINGVNTRLGGSYVDFVINGIMDELSGMIKRKYKVELQRSTLKNGFTFVMFAKNFVNPKYDSQTKERLTNTNTQVKSHFEDKFKYDFKYIAKKLMDFDDFIKPLVEAQIAKKEANERREAAIEERKLKKVRVAKHISASGKNARLILVEGDSALGPSLKVRNPVTTGFFPLRGVVMNTWTENASTVLKNKELSELMAILNIKVSDADSYKEMEYANISIMADADHDGEKISTLLVGFFYKYWPKMIEEGRLSIIRSPIMISSNKKDTKWFYSYEEANDFKEKSNGYKHRYIKGLASLEEHEYDVIINDPVVDIIKIDDPSLFEMMFGDDTKLRKDFMMA